MLLLVGDVLKVGILNIIELLFGLLLAYRRPGFLRLLEHGPKELQQYSENLGYNVDANDPKNKPNHDNVYAFFERGL